ncbi:hypothetical protein ACFLZX_01520 [Nanoarchaeota archaeon]
MKIKLLVLLFSIMLLAGCAEEGDDKPDKEVIPDDIPPDVKPPDNGDQVQPPGPPMPPEPEVPPEPKVMDPEAQKMIDSFSKVTSYSYSTDLGKVLVKGDNARIDLFRGTYGKNNWRYDVVYLDIPAKKAYSVCISRTSCTLDDRKHYNVASYLDYDLGKLPAEYIEEIVGAEVAEAKSRTFSRGTTQAKSSLLLYEIEGVEYETWLDNFYGFPYEIKMKEGSSTTLVEYPDVEINNVADEDVILPGDLELTE